jgi:hypothetical protein
VGPGHPPRAGSDARGRVHLKKLKDGNAKHTPAILLASQPRKFGLIYISTSEQSEQVTDLFQAELNKNGCSSPSASPTSRPSICRTTPGLIAKLKASGVTSVLLSGDP